MKTKPHPAGAGDFPLAQLNKSFMALSLNKMTRTYGGSSGYSSEARIMRESGRYSVKGHIKKKDIVKTIIHTNGKRISRKEFVSRLTAFKMPFTTKIEYLNKWGDVMEVIDTKFH